MIVSDIIELKVKLPITNSMIEDEFKNRKLNVLRWAIVDVTDNRVKVQLSYLKV